MNETDPQLKLDIENELDWDSKLEIAVCQRRPRNVRITSASRAEFYEESAVITRHVDC